MSCHSRLCHGIAVRAGRVDPTQLRIHFQDSEHVFHSEARIARAQGTEDGPQNRINREETPGHSSSMAIFLRSAAIRRTWSSVYPTMTGTDMQRDSSSYDGRTLCHRSSFDSP